MKGMIDVSTHEKKDTGEIIEIKALVFDRSWGVYCFKSAQYQVLSQLDQF
jgi:hypothetical protein